MTPYANLGGDSGVSNYEIGSNFIKVEFNTGAVYVYDDVKPGTSDLDQMKALAISGVGLNSFISRHVRSNFAYKE